MQTHDSRYVIGLGSNLGDRQAFLRQGVRELTECAGVTQLACSSFYESEPMGGPPQGDYLNAAALLTTPMTPTELLDRLLGIEASLGRVRRERDGPRTLDLDILWWEGGLVESERLIVPHPRLADRAFALLPLLELVPFAVDPRTGERYQHLLTRLPQARIRRC